MTPRSLAGVQPISSTLHWVGLYAMALPSGGILHRLAARVDGPRRPDAGSWRPGSGRASQEDSSIWRCGLASMYPAFDWSTCSRPSWISARVRSH
jgi:hypothetical protein